MNLTEETVSGICKTVLRHTNKSVSFYSVYQHLKKDLFIPCSEGRSDIASIISLVHLFMSTKNLEKFAIYNSVEGFLFSYK